MSLPLRQQGRFSASSGRHMGEIYPILIKHSHFLWQWKTFKNAMVNCFKISDLGAYILRKRKLKPASLTWYIYDVYRDVCRQNNNSLTLDKLASSRPVLRCLHDRMCKATVYHVCFDSMIYNKWHQWRAKNFAHISIIIAGSFKLFNRYNVEQKGHNSNTLNVSAV